VTNSYDELGRVKAQTVPRQTGSVTYNLYFSGYRNVEEDGAGNQTMYHFDGKKLFIGWGTRWGGRFAWTESICL